MAIYDLDGHVILSADFAISSGQEAECSVLIDCVDGYVLSGESVDGLTVEARHGSSGSYTILGTLSLAAWDGQQELFQIRLTAGPVERYQRRAFRLTVSR